MSVVKIGRKGLFAFFCAFSLVVVTGCEDDDTPADTTPPVISNLSHADQEEVIGSRTITFSVDVTDDVGATVSITHNGNPVTVTPSGDTYSASITLEDRDANDIEVSASDADNTTTETVTLKYPFLAFTDGQAASVVIGQINLDSTNTHPNKGNIFTPSIDTLSRPKDVEIQDGRLYVADSENNRISVFNTLPISNNTAANFVIGQDSVSTSDSGTDNNQLRGPLALEAGDGHLYISSIGRIHYWTVSPVSGNDPANFVIGKSDFVLGNLLNCSQTEITFGVGGLSYFGGKIIAANTDGHRILIWNSIPIANGEAANMVLGQNGYDSCLFNVSETAIPTDKSMNKPTGVWSDGARLVVADTENNRVLIWNTFPTTNYQAADLVLGQLTFTTANAPSAMNEKEILQPNGVYSNGNQLFVSTGADRILIWDSWPTENEQAANRVLGFSSMTSTTPLINGAGLSNPGGMDTYEDKLIIADTDNNRVLIFQAQ